MLTSRAVQAGIAGLSFLPLNNNHSSLIVISVTVHRFFFPKN